MDAIKVGILTIGAISVTVVVCGAVIHSPEVIASGAGGAGLIGGWLGHAAYSAKKEPEPEKE